MMTTSREERVETLVALGRRLQDSADEAMETAIRRASHENPWFTIENIQQSIDAICREYLDRSKLEDWLSQYPELKSEAKTVGLILAGNIPLVGWHDILSVYVSGHKAKVKYSSKDEVLMKHIVGLLQEEDAGARESIVFVERLKDYDAVIATGSNNSSRYFEEYFSHVPNIIRRNRNAVAVLTGTETKEDFIALGKDIFTYFGLGCRNVSKIYVPNGYDFSPMLEALHDEYKEMVLHHKYKNNFDFNNALFMLNQDDFLMNGCLMVRASKDIPSRIASVHYETYEDMTSLAEHLRSVNDQLQCIVSKEQVPTLSVLPLGMAQQPGISDYADGVDTMKFLNSII